MRVFRCSPPISEPGGRIGLPTSFLPRMRSTTELPRRMGFYVKPRDAFYHYRSNVGPYPQAALSQLALTANCDELPRRMGFYVKPRDAFYHYRSNVGPYPQAALSQLALTANCDELPRRMELGYYIREEEGMESE